MEIRKAITGILVISSLVAGLLATTVTPAAAAFSGANGWIAFSSDRDGDDEIYIMRPDGTALVKLTNNNFSDTEPNVSADGTKIAFISDRSGSPEVWAMKIDSTSPIKLTAHTMIESHPVWNPLGGMLAFAGRVGTDSEIYKMNNNGTGRVNLTNDPVAFDANPAWSPGGIRLAFDSTNRDGDPGTNVYTIENHGGDLQQLTTTGADSHPNYAPDNQNIVFQSTRDTASGPTVFGAVNQPTGVAVTNDAVLVTQFNNDRVRALDANGVMSTFADLPATGNRDSERYIAVSPGLGGFPADYVYVTVGKDIYEITPDGDSVSLFVNIPELLDSQTGITFDTVGDFGNKMILTDRSGPIWTVDSSGTATQIGDLGRHVQESPVVAPASFDPYGGQLLIGSKFVDKIYAMTPDGTFSIVEEWDSPKGGNVVPSTACEFQTSGGAYFLAVRGLNQIMKFSAAHFAGLGGDVLMPSELTTDIARLHSDGSSVNISQFWGPIGSPDLEGSGFAPCGSGPAAPAGSAQAAETHEIYRMTTSGSGQSRLTSNAFDDTMPAWSPNGDTIVFSTDRDDPNAPGCRDLGTCIDELYTMDANSGAGQANVSNNGADDVSADWQAVSTQAVAVTDFAFGPPTAKPKQGGSVMWDFFGPTSHTATDDSGMGLFDSGIKAAGTYYVYRFTVAGKYSYTCTLHPTQMNGTVRVPIKSAPVSGTLSTEFTITWAAAIPGGYRVDIQIVRPGETDFVDWMVDKSTPSAVFMADAGTGTYSFRARLERTSNGETSDYSTPVTITVNP